MGWNEWPLMLFTVLAQSAVGAFWFSAIFLLVGKDAPEVKDRMERAMLLIWIAMGAAFLFSTAHLGSPMRAANALFRVGQAPLSNEALFGSLFIACGGIAWLLAMLRRNAQARKVLYGVGLVLSAVFLWSMISFYMMPTVPTWNTPLTPLAFLVTTVLGGAVLANVLFSIAKPECECHGKTLAYVAVMALLAGALVTMVLIAGLSGINSSIQQAGALSPDIGGLMALRFLLLAIAIGLLFHQISDKASAMPIAVIGFVLVAAGEIIGRGVFYALYMTVGLV